MEAYLRNWFENALSKKAYDTAVFVGDKLLALTNSDEDALALAEVHFDAGSFSKALASVSRSDLIQRSPASRYLAAHCYIKLNKHDEALGVLGEKNPVHLLTTSDPLRRKWQHISPAVTSKSHGKSRLYSRTERIDRSEERSQEGASNIRYEAGMCYLRGLCYAKQNAFDRAKECYQDAVRIDVQCFEAFDQLMKNALMSPKEEWDYLDSLNFNSITLSPEAPPEEQAEATSFTRNLYITRLSKYAEPEQFKHAIETLSSHYGLSQNPDILLCEAERAFTSSRSQSALTLTSSILEMDPFNFNCIPLHLALLHQLKHTHSLFALAHDLADTHPSEPCTWLAVGTYYLATNRIPEARSFFSKASLMDPHFGAAWIGFAHTFAAEGESDQAIAAYSTAARLFQGTHLPQLFLGMQEIALNNLSLAREYLAFAYKLCPHDPLLINELGVVAYLENDPVNATNYFELALSIAEQNSTPDSDSQMSRTRLNLAHSLRRAGRWLEALAQFDECIRISGGSPVDDAGGVFTAKGLVYLELDQPFEATVALHEALAIAPQDPIASELLSRALAELENDEVLGEADEEAFDRGIWERVKTSKVESRNGARRRQRGGDKQGADGNAETRLGGARARRVASSS